MIYLSLQNSFTKNHIVSNHNSNNLGFSKYFRVKREIRNFVTREKKPNEVYATLLTEVRRWSETAAYAKHRKKACYPFGSRWKKRFQGGSKGARRKSVINTATKQWTLYYGSKRNFGSALRASLSRAHTELSCIICRICSIRGERTASGRARKATEPRQISNLCLPFLEIILLGDDRLPEFIVPFSIFSFSSVSHDSNDR